MADIINLLPAHVANQIAAGEVVQRPSSVVKELIENSIDAGSSLIQVLISDGGKKMIKVVDNGCGMSNNDARKSIKRHATSKIETASDIFSIKTKGFRGEALSSIAAVSQVDLKTRIKDNELAINLRVEGNSVKDEKFLLSPIGTSVSIHNLFYNIPARRKFLKSDSVELRHIIDEFHRVSISHPEIQFKFTHNSNELFDLKPAELKKRIIDIFGEKINEKLVPIKEKTSLANISGFILKPDFSKKTRINQFFFVNNRFIKSPFLNHSVLSSYEGLLKPNYKPGYFLFFKVDTDSIDVNIHPTKTEIKFENEQSLYAILKSTIKHSLGMFNISPSLDFNYNESFEPTYGKSKSGFNNPKIEVNSNFNPFENDDNQVYFKSNSNSNYNESFIEVESKSFPNSLNNLLDFKSSAIKLFQFMNKYIVSSVQSGILIIHQSRAHERILYENFLKRITQTNVSTQKLVIPIEYKINKNEKVFFSELSDVLTSCGFTIILKKEFLLEINGIPEKCPKENVKSIIDDIFESFQNKTSKINFSQADIIAKSFAKKNAIKNNISLEISEQQKILDDLFSCKETLISPFNKKIFISVSNDELKKKFNL